MKQSHLRLMGILVLVLASLFINRFTAPYICLEYNDVGNDGKLGCLDEGLTDHGKTRVLIVNYTIIGLGIVAVVTTLLKRQRKSSNVAH